MFEHGLMLLYVVWEKEIDACNTRFEFLSRTRRFKLATKLGCAAYQRALKVNQKVEELGLGYKQLGDEEMSVCSSDSKSIRQYGRWISATIGGDQRETVQLWCI